MRKTLIILIFILAFCLLPKIVEAGIIMKPVFQAGLVGYWDFQEGAGINVYDKSGQGNTGTWAGTGSHWADGKIGKAGNFNGDDDYVDLGTIDSGNSLMLANSDVTIAAWVKQSSGGDQYQRIVDKTDAPNGADGYDLYFSLINGEFMLQVNGNKYYRDISSDGYSYDTWYYVTGVITATAFHLYINGEEKSGGWAEGSPALPPNVQTNMRIGTWNHSTGREFNGLIDEVRIYNRALSASEVERLYKLSQPKILAAPRNGLVGYWSFNEGSGTKVGDMSGNGNHGTWNGAGSHWTDGKFGKAGKFVESSGDYVEVDDNASLRFGTGDFTVSVWIKFPMDVPVDGWNGIVTKGYSVMGTTHTWGLIRWYDSTNAVTYYDNHDDEDHGNCSVNSIALSDGWHLVTAVRDSSGCTIYTDAKKGDHWNASPSNLYATVPLRIGADPARICGGTFDEVRLYNRALETSEITALYNSGLQKINASQNNQITNGLVGFWSFNGPDMDGNTATDRSGQGNDGTITGATRTIGKVGQALSFNVNGDVVALLSPTSLDDIENQGGGGMSISAWVYPRDFSVGSPIVNKLLVSSSGWWHFGLAVNAGQAILRFEKDFANVDLDAFTHYGDVVTNKWQHVAMTWDGSSSAANIHLYVDGVEQTWSRTDGDGIKNSDADINMYIGSDVYGNAAHGKVDEVRIYNRALTAQEILRLYNLGR